MKKKRNKIVLISQQGSGTNLLRSFLNSHPDIHFAGELFIGTKKSPKPDINVDKYLDNFIKEHSDKRIIGFDLKYNQNNIKIIKYLFKNKFKVLHLIRDPARTFMKQVNMYSANYFKFDYKDVMNYVDDVNLNIEITQAYFNNRSFGYKEIYYEDMTRGKEINILPKDFEKDLLKWIGVKYKKLEIKINDEVIVEKLKKRF